MNRMYQGFARMYFPVEQSLVHPIHILLVGSYQGLQCKGDGCQVLEPTKCVVLGCVAIGNRQSSDSLCYAYEMQTCTEEMLQFFTIPWLKKVLLKKYVVLGRYDASALVTGSAWRCSVVSHVIGCGFALWKHAVLCRCGHGSHKISLAIDFMVACHFARGQICGACCQHSEARQNGQRWE